ncbi:MAG: dienelactone hydrolase family protein [Betaproteobacteria bacterium]|nr:dienelactone hydrolase family protein [Betaproteobacteria bacterium]
MAVGWETIQVDGKDMRVYVGVPERAGRHPGIVIAQHGPGVDAQIQDAVHRLHREGYVVAAPELFHRQPPDVDPGKRTGLLRDDEIIADINATVAHLKRMPMTVAPLGIAGFCMGGRVVYLMACVNPEFKAAAVFYGGNIFKALGGGPSPFERSAGIRCPIIGFFGAEDTNPAPDDVKKIDTELTRLGKWHEFHTYNNAGHAFQNFSSAERYRERAARASWTEMLAFFTEYLKRGTAA